MTPADLEHRKPAPAPIRTILTMDVGSATTRAVLLDTVEHEYRFVAHGEAPTTAMGPLADIQVGMRAATEQLELVAGRALVTGGLPQVPEDVDGDGADTVAITVGCPPPLPLVVVAPYGHEQLPGILEAVSSVPTRIIHIIPSREAMADPAARWLNRQMDRIRALRQPAILVMGGSEERVEPTVAAMLAAIGATALANLREDDKAPVVYAGNPMHRDQLKGLLGAQVDLKLIALGSGPANDRSLEPLRATVRELVIRGLGSRAPGFHGAAQWTRATVHMSSAGFEQTVRFITEQHQKSVAAVSIGAGTTGVFATDSSQMPHFVTSGDYGLGQAALRVLDEAGWEQVSRWLTHPLSEREARTYLAEKLVNPQLVPDQPEWWSLEMALAREAVRLTATETGGDLLPSGGHYNLVVGSGRIFDSAPTPAAAALLLLDMVQPSLLTTLTIDGVGLLPQLGTFVGPFPQLVSQVLERGGLFHLGICIVPVGTGRPGEPAVRVIIDYPDQSSSSTDVAYGSLQVVPLKSGQRAGVRLYPGRQFDVGKGKGAPAKLEQETDDGAVGLIDGGLVGLIVDARGRPLTLPTSPEQRVAKLQQWFEQIGANK